MQIVSVLSCFYVAAACTRRLVTGCYDNSIHLWRPQLPAKMGAPWLSDQPSAHVLKLANAHDFYVQCVRWVPGGRGLFVSTSMDQTARVWRFNKDSTSVDCLYTCKGHRKTVDALACSTDGKMFATGSHDGTIKFWTTDNSNVVDSKPAAKKQRGDAKKPKKKAPAATLSAHTEGAGVTSLVYAALTCVASAAQDHTVRLWDTQAKQRWVTRRFFSPLYVFAQYEILNYIVYDIKGDSYAIGSS